jgi:hypothetical protein
MQLVQEEIQQPNRIAAAFPGLNSIVLGQIICDLNVTSMPTASW